MARIGLGLAAIAAAVLMLGATPASACGNEGAGHSCHCMGGAKAEARAEPKAERDAKAEVRTAPESACGQDGAQCACTGGAAVQAPVQSAPSATPAPAPAPKAEAKQAAPQTKPQSCTLRTEDGALAGKCSCGGPADCTCKKNDCQCGKCKQHRAGEGSQGV